MKISVFTKELDLYGFNRYFRPLPYQLQISAQEGPDIFLFVNFEQIIL